MAKLRWTDPPREADPARVQADSKLTVSGVTVAGTVERVAAEQAGLDRATRRLKGLEQIRLRYGEQRSALYATITQRPLHEFIRSYAELAQKLTDTDRAISTQRSIQQRLQASLTRRGLRRP